MKKILLCLTVIILLILFCGCEQKPANTSLVEDLNAPPASVAPSPVQTEEVAASASPVPVKATASPAASPAAKAVQKNSIQNTAPPLAATEEPIPSPAPEPEQKDEITVSAIDNNGTMIMSAVNVAYEDNMTVFDALKAASRITGVSLASRGFGSAVYIEGIGGLFEFDQGAKSGWLYSVNGARPGKSAGGVKLKSGDAVVWRYTITGN